MPPATEAAVHQAASRNARSGRASDIGTSITSGGIGKKELSTNATAVNIPRACRLPAAATHQSYKRRSKEIGLAASTVIGTLRVREGGSAALADAPSFQRHNLTPRRGLYQFLRHFFGNAKHLLAPAHLVPDLVGVDPGMNPEHHEIVQQIGAFADHRFGLAVQ